MEDGKERLVIYKLYVFWLGGRGIYINVNNVGGVWNGFLYILIYYSDVVS